MSYLSDQHVPGYPGQQDCHATDHHSSHTTWRFEGQLGMFPDVFSCQKQICFMGISQWESDHHQVPKEQLAYKDRNKRKAAT